MGRTLLGWILEKLVHLKTGGGFWGPSLSESEHSFTTVKWRKQGSLLGSRNVGHRKRKGKILLFKRFKMKSSVINMSWYLILILDPDPFDLQQLVK